MKKRISILFSAVILLGALYFPFLSKVNASGGQLCSESIMPPNYTDNGDTSQYLFDPRYPTMTGSTLLYQNGKIGILLYNCSYTGIYNYDPGNYILQTFIRKSNGEMVYLPQVDRAALLNNWSDVRRVGPVDVHKTLDFAPYFIDGAAPLRPNINFVINGQWGEKVEFSGSCDWNKTKYSFDYYGINKKTGRQSYIEDEYTFLKADDYICGFYYTVDKNSRDTPFSYAWTRLNSNDYSGATRKLSADLQQSVVSSSEDYYVHVAAISYTGKVSPVSTKKIPKRGVHTVKYDLCGGEGYINPSLKCYGKPMDVTDIIPRKKGYTFVEWRGQSGESYKPTASYTRDQDGGEYKLTAVWKENTVTIRYNKNDSDGRNGKVTGEMKEQVTSYTKSGLLPCEFKNESVDEFGVNKFKFTGYSMNSTDLLPRILERDILNFPISKLVDSMGLSYEENVVIELYSIWDEQADLKNVKDRYITSEQGKNIKEELLLEGVYAEDREDGKIDEIRISDFRVDDFFLKGDKGGVYLFAEVCDSAGNISKKGFWVYIVSSNPIVDEKNAQQYIRFIDKENYKNKNLSKDSIWYWNNEYKKAFESIDVNKPKRVVKISL